MVVVVVYIYGCCFTYMYVCAAHFCLVPMEATRVIKSPLEFDLVVSCYVDGCPLEEQPCS